MGGGGRGDALLISRFDVPAVSAANAHVLESTNAEASVIVVSFIVALADARGQPSSGSAQLPGCPVESCPRQTAWGGSVRKAVLGMTRARVAVEAAVELGWERYIGLEGRFVGMHSFGASGKIADVYKKFEITAESVIRAAQETLAETAAL